MSGYAFGQSDLRGFAPPDTSGKSRGPGGVPTAVFAIHSIFCILRIRGLGIVLRRLAMTISGDQLPLVARRWAFAEEEAAA